jgi:glutamyl-tRNA reductase
MNSVYLTLLGLNHNTAPIEIREKIFIPESAIPEFLNKMKRSGIDESVVVSTCNRTEVYFHSFLHETSLVKIRNMLSEISQVQPGWLEDYIYTFHNEDACRHLFSVASGLDSLVIGEPEILGQVKDAYRIAGFHNTTGFILNKVFHKTFNVAKKIRTETKVGHNPLSISSMAIELAKNIFGELDKRKILVVGAGTMCRTALKYFQKEGLQEVLIANRTYKKAQELAEDVLGTAYPFHELARLFTEVDMVLTSTGSGQPFIDKTFIDAIMKERKSRPLFLIDIAVPRDIAAEVSDIDNVYLYNIDSLKELSQNHLSDRLKEAEKARIIIEEELKQFSQFLRELSMNPLIEHIVEKAEIMRTRELDKALRKLNNVDDDIVQAMDALTKTITNKLVHSHIALIKENNDATLMDIYRRYFHFEDDKNEDKMDNRDQS